MRTALIVLILAAILILAACGPEPPPRETPLDRNPNAIGVLDVTLKDGATVECVYFDGYNGEGGLTCNWDAIQGRNGGN